VPTRLVGKKPDFCLAILSEDTLQNASVPQEMKPLRKSEGKEAFGGATSNMGGRAPLPDESSGETLISPLAKTKILIVHHVCWIRRAVRNLINQSERFAVCAETDDPRDAITLFEQHQPKIVVLDLVLAQGDGFTFIKSLIKLSPAALILVLSSDEGVMSICRALRAGAVGYLTVEDGDLELPIALDTIAAGAYYVSKRLWNVVLKSFARGALRQIKADANLLTDRELEVFSLIGRGAGVVEMAEKLGVSGKTVETHQMRIKQKLNLGSAADLRKYAVHSMAKM
jgi:DNA-binding NarL/FixJ family response regulator